MKTAKLLLGALVIGFAVLIAMQANWAPSSRRGSADAATDSLGPVELQTQEGDLVRVRRSTLPPPASRDFAAIDRALAEGRGVTYMDEILASRGGNVARWVDRRDDPITVWIQRATGLADFWPDYPELVRDAFYTWSNAGIPLRFLFVNDSASAEVRVRWVDRFTDATAGKTYWARDINWWILGADIELSLHSAQGEKYDRQAVRAIALHEVGHLIGLDHSASPDNIMAPRVQTLHLSTTDLRTANLVYRLPPGPARDTAK